MDCTKCDYHTTIKAHYERHLESAKHRYPKDDYTCLICGYLAPNRQSYLRHQKIDCLKTKIEYSCGPCEYSTSCKQKYNTHLMTQLHSMILTPVIAKDVTPGYLLSRYRKSAVKCGMYYLGYRRVSTYSKYIIFQNKLVSLDDYTTAYKQLEEKLKTEEGYLSKYARYAYKNGSLVDDLEYPFFRHHEKSC